MTNNTNRANPPTQWGIGAVDAGGETYYRTTPDADPPISGILVWHWCEAPVPGPRWMAASVNDHTLIALEPLHLEPSLLWPCCQRHGYLRAGRWEST